MRLLSLFIFSVIFFGCSKPEVNLNEIWIYTSLYKDTISKITPMLKKEFPNLKFNFFQAGSEEIATKVNAEILAGSVKADVIICSDRFWLEEMSQLGKLHKYQNSVIKKLPNQFKSPKGEYAVLSLPVMVLAYNKEAIRNPPTSFKELTNKKWKDMFTSGSPLASGTNFTTMAMLQHHYGWKFFEKLRDNNVIAQGGNSAVIRRLQNKERKVGWVLLENILRFQGKDERIVPIYPDDGVVIQANVIAVTKKEVDRKNVEKFVDWMFSDIGQSMMTDSYMYSPMPSFPPPKGAPAYKKIFANAFPWTQEFIENVVKNRINLKEKYTEIMFE